MLETDGSPRGRGARAARRAAASCCSTPRRRPSSRRRGSRATSSAPCRTPARRPDSTSATASACSCSFTSHEDAGAVAAAFETADVAGETLAARTRRARERPRRAHPAGRAAGGLAPLVFGADPEHVGYVPAGAYANRGGFHVAVDEDRGRRASTRPGPRRRRLRGAAASGRASAGCSRAWSARAGCSSCSTTRSGRTGWSTSPGTNGKTSTSRIIESLVRAHGLRTGLFTSPHLERFTERIMVDGEPIDDAAVADAWDEIAPVRRPGRRRARGGGRRAADVLRAAHGARVRRVRRRARSTCSCSRSAWAGRGTRRTPPTATSRCSPRSTSTTPTASARRSPRSPPSRRGSSRTAPPSCRRSRMPPPKRCCAPPRPTQGATIAFEGADFALTEQRLAVGGQLISVRGLAGHVRRRVPAAVRRPPGLQRRARDRRGRVAHRRRDRTPIAGDILAEGLGAGDVARAGCSSSGSSPTVLVDAAHNPHGARALVAALRESFDFDEWGVVLGVLADKDAGGHRRRARPGRRARLRDGTRLGARRATPTTSPTSPRRTGCRSTVHRRSRGRRRGRARVGRGIRSSRRRRRGLGRARRRGARARRRRGLEGRVERVSATRDRRSPRAASAPRRGRGGVARVDRARLRVDRGVPRRARRLRAEGAARADRRRGGASSAGVVLAVLMVLTTGCCATAGAIWLGWALQVVVALGAFLVPALGLVGAHFRRHVRVCDDQGRRPRPAQRATRREPPDRARNGERRLTWPPKRPSSSSSPTASPAD